MATDSEFQTPPQNPAELEKTLNTATAAVEDLDLNETTNGKATEPDQHVNGVKPIESDHVPLQPVVTASADLGLPHVSAEGLVVKTPLSKPMENVKPAAKPALTAEQGKKYDTLLEKVSTWTEVPESSAKGAKSQPLEEYERMFLTRECLLRYLRATSWKLDQAETRLRNTLIWRREYGTDKHTADYISPENETGKQVILGWDIDGRPCCYLRPSKQNTEKSDRQIEHLVYMLERTIDLMPPGQEMLALLINFSETKSGQNATLAQGKQTLNILQNHYPERLGRALVTNVPFLIWGFFKLITPFIDPITREKIKFNEDMGLHVPREQLMKESNGDVEFEYDHSLYWPALTKLCQIKREAYRERWERAGKRVGEYEMYLRGGDQKPLIEIEKVASQN